MSLESFEEAFHQIDQDYDGIIKKVDLENYVQEKNLNENFVKKWLRLFGDENDVIQYENFCKTLGIVPKKIFSPKAYKTDMTDSTKTTVINILKKHNNKSVIDSNDQTRPIVKDLKSELKGDWSVEVDPNADQIRNTSYREDGLIHLSLNPDSEKDPKYLVYRTKDDTSKYPIYKQDMKDRTKWDILDIFASPSGQDGVSKPDEIHDKINGKWQVIYNPKDRDLDQPYDSNGLVCFSTSQSGEPKILVFKEISGIKYPCKILQADMTMPTQVTVMKCVNTAITKSINGGGTGSEEHLSNISDIDDHENADNAWNNKVANTLTRKYGGCWFVDSVEDDKCVPTKYANDGLLYYIPGNLQDEQRKVLVYKMDDNDITKNMMIHNVDMSDPVKQHILQMIQKNIDPELDPVDQKSNWDTLTEHFDEKFGVKWNFVSNPTKNQLKAKYGFDGQIYLTPNTSYRTRVLLWRTDASKMKGCFCCC